MGDSEHTEEEKEIDNPLGITDSALGSLKPNDLINNKALARVVLNYTKSCNKKIAELETENETLKTYPNAYEKRKLQSKIAALLALPSTICVGFGVGILTAPNTNSNVGLILLGIGVLLGIGSIFLSFIDL